MVVKHTPTKRGCETLSIAHCLSSREPGSEARHTYRQTGDKFEAHWSGFLEPTTVAMGLAGPFPTN